MSGSIVLLGAVSIQLVSLASRELSGRLHCRGFYRLVSIQLVSLASRENEQIALTVDPNGLFPFNWFP